MPAHLLHEGATPACLSMVARESRWSIGVASGVVKPEARWSDETRGVTGGNGSEFACASTSRTVARPTLHKRLPPLRRTGTPRPSSYWPGLDGLRHRMYSHQRSPDGAPGPCVAERVSAAPCIY